MNFFVVLDDGNFLLRLVFLLKGFERAQILLLGLLLGLPDVAFVLFGPQILVLLIDLAVLMCDIRQGLFVLLM